ncbi:MAG: hypothetical protein LIP01_12365, partial [Tannerellaceae bacterium]|nr:hypothetical protein [Tannerellaceae bacterium]
SILNEIEDDLQTIREAENYVTINQGDIEQNSSKRELIRQNMLLVKETLQKNKEKINDLEARLNKSNIQSGSLRKTIERLTSELEARSATIATLQTELAKKDSQIRDMGEMMSGMNEEIENLALTNQAQTEALRKQDKEINTGYYCFGTSKELKDQKIISKGGLFDKSQVLQDSFNKDYFISVDIRELKEVPLFARKAKLLSNHPDGSYELIADAEKNLTLFIHNYNQFWSMSKYLVIEVGL